MENNNIEKSSTREADEVFGSYWMSILIHTIFKVDGIRIYISEKKELYFHILNSIDILHYGLFVKQSKEDVVLLITKHKNTIWRDAPFLNMITPVFIDRNFKIFLQHYFYSPQYIAYKNTIIKEDKDKTYLFCLTTRVNKITKEQLYYFNCPEHVFITSKLQYDLKKYHNSKTPIFLECLKTWFNTNNISEQIVQAFLATLSLIYSGNFIDTKSILVIEGIPGSGKSLLSKLLQSLVGTDNIASVDTSSLTTNQFSKSVLLKKSGLIINDSNEKLTGAAQEILKGLSGKDTYSCEIKFENDRKLITWNGFIIIITNYFLEFLGSLGDLHDRKLTFYFNKKLDLKKYEEIEPVLDIRVSSLSNGRDYFDFSGELVKELPYIADFLLHFNTVEENKRIIKRYKEYLVQHTDTDSNLIEGFLTKYCIYAEKHNIEFGTAYQNPRFDETTLTLFNKNGSVIYGPDDIGPKIDLYPFYLLHCANQNIKETITRNKFKNIIKSILLRNKDFSKCKVVKDSRGYFTLKNARYKTRKEVTCVKEDISFEQYCLEKSYEKETIPNGERSVEKNNEIPHFNYTNKIIAGYLKQPLTHEQAASLEAEYIRLCDLERLYTNLITNGIKPGPEKDMLIINLSDVHKDLSLFEKQYIDLERTHLEQTQKV